MTEALSQDQPILKIMDKTRHTTLASIRAYHRPERARVSDPTSRLLDAQRPLPVVSTGAYLA